MTTMTAEEEPITTTTTPSLSKVESTTESEVTPVRPPPDEATWKLIRETYRKVKEGSLDDWDVALFKSFESGTNGFHVPYEVRQSPGKGRGLFATELIPKDTVVCEDLSGHFVTESQWREFLELLPRELAIDAVSWAYVEEYEGKDAVWLDLYEGSLMNHGEEASMLTKLRASLCGCKKNEGLIHNANLNDRFHDGKWYMHATRDIQKGEELLCDYYNFHNYGNELSWFDDTWEEYIGDDSSGIHDYS